MLAFWLFAILIQMKTTPTALTLLMVLAILLISCNSIAPYTGGETPFAKDLATMVQTLETNHSNPYSQIGREEFRALVSTTEHLYSDKDETTQYFAMRSLLATLGDSHTSLAMSKENQKNLTVFPLTFSRFAGRYYLGAIDTAYTAHLGEEITSLNGHSMQEVETALAGLVSHDNEAWLMQSLPNLINLPSALVFSGLAKQGEPLTIKTSEGNSLSLQSVSLASQDKDKLATILGKTYPVTFPNGERYRYFMLAEDTLFLQYNSCSNDPAYPIGQFISEVTTSIVTEKPKTLLLDLRFNGGGNSTLLEPLIREIASIQERQPLCVYVLIGAGTFSSALMNAVQCKQRIQCTLVGTPTGGSVNHFGEVKTKLLEMSGNTLHYSTKHFVMDKKTKGSLQPDILVEQTLGDYLNGIDSVVATLL